MTDADDSTVRDTLGQLETLDYYALLSVADNADSEQIRDAFHLFALHYHPDRFQDEPEQKSYALQIFKRGSEAYRVLMHATLRARFDAARRRGALRLSPDEMFAEGDATIVDAAIPPAARAFFDKAVESLDRNDFKAARMHLMLARSKGNSPRFDELAKRIDSLSKP
ncbi:MAG: J domain-containing protein [Deltaproteobacteria bacterium]|nr:J domain-containing protein [Deltaproteobacteria bacterium]